MNNIYIEVKSNGIKFHYLINDYYNDNLDLELRRFINRKINSPIQKRMFFVSINKHLTNINL